VRCPRCGGIELKLVSKIEPAELNRLAEAETGRTMRALLDISPNQGRRQNHR